MHCIDGPFPVTGISFSILHNNKRGYFDINNDSCSAQYSYESSLKYRRHFQPACTCKSNTWFIKFEGQAKISRCFQFKRHQYRAIFHLQLFIYNALCVILFDTLHIRNTSFRAFSILAHRTDSRPFESEKHLSKLRQRFKNCVVCFFYPHSYMF